MANEKIVNRENLKAFRQKLDNRYAKPDGNYPTLTSGLADNLTPYSEDSGAEQENPFISQGTGTNNNQEIVTVGDYALMKEKQGNSVVVNQFAKELNSTNWATNNATVSYLSGVATFTVTANGGSIRQYINCISGHKYLLSTTIKLTTATNLVQLGIYDGAGVRRIYVPSTTNKQFVSGIVTAENTPDSFGGAQLQIRDDRLRDWDAIEVSNCIAIDLTQWFNGDIPQDLLDNPDNFYRYYNGDLSYNTGSLENANGVKLVSTGRNIWDEEWEVGTISGGVNDNTDTSKIRSKNYTKVIGGATYYYKCGYSCYVSTYDSNKNFIKAILVSANSTFILDYNVSFIRFSPATAYGNTYNHDITISLYYTPEQGGEGYDKYYPYEEPYVVDTGTEVLRSAGSVKDYKEPNGTIHRLVGTKTLSSNDVSAIGTTYTNIVYYQIDKPSDYSGVGNYSATLGKISMADFINSANAVSPDSTDYIGKIITASQTVLYLGFPIGTTLEQAKAKLDGKTIYYELATETTEQGTPFAENLPINDYGMLYWLDSSDKLVGIPQGAKIFYPTNYKGFVDDMYSRVGGDASKYVIDSELSASETQRDTIDTQLKNAIGGTLRQCLCVKESLDFDNTDVADLGTINPTYNSAWNCWQFNLITNIKPVTSNSTPAKILASNMKTVAASGYTSSHANNTVALNTSGQLFVDNGSSTIKPEGVLLAYEKA